MKNLFLILFLSILTLTSFGQQDVHEIIGSVSFLSSQSVYVRFSSTEGLKVGDTLYVKLISTLTPALLIHELSSISCRTTPIGTVALAVNSNVYGYYNPKNSQTNADVKSFEVQLQKQTEAVAVTDATIKNPNQSIKTTSGTNVSGRLSLSSFSHFSDDPLSLATPNVRMRYNLALNIQHNLRTKWSFESYSAFTHYLVSSNNNQAKLNVYNASFNYFINNNLNISVGRKINPNAANVGAVDGLQVNKKIGQFMLGVIAGSRPNDSTYSLDPALLQYGAYIAHDYRSANKSSLSSIAFFNQTNRFVTDRRYIYLQHSNSLLKRIDLFASSEIDLYRKYASVDNTPAFTSLFLMLSYSPFRTLTTSLSYDARKNVYYYETYKNRVDSLLDKETRKGCRLRIRYTPFRFMAIGANAGYRVNSPTQAPSMNVISYIHFNQIPVINVGLMLNATALRSENLSGYIFGGSVSKSFLSEKMMIQAEYRKELIYNSDILGCDISWLIGKKFSLVANIEECLTDSELQTRFFLNFNVKL